MSKRTRGVIAAGHPATAEAGAEMLRCGGNAFDAVVAAAFASFVCELTLTSAGGGGFLTAYNKETGASHLFDFFVNRPGIGTSRQASRESFFPVRVDFGSTHQEFHVGACSVAVPGNLAGLFEVHHRFGDLPLHQILEPAIHLAQEGFVITQHQAYFIALLEPIRTLTHEGRIIVSPQGRLLGEGDQLYMKDFARTLERFADEGPASFYTGDLAELAVQTLKSLDGLMTREDLENYRVEVRPPLVFDYRDFSIVTNPPPAAGGGLIALCLKMIEGIPLSSQDALSSRLLDAQIAAMQLTNVVRNRGYDTWLHTERSLVNDFLRPEQIAEYQTQLQKSLTDKEWKPALSDLPGGCSSTTHISVMDEKGNAASLTTSNGEGSGIFIPGTGIMLNNMLGEEDLNPEGFHDHQPGRRISSMMSPTIVLKGREPVAVLGSGGSNRIRTAIFQAVVNLIDFEKDVEEAVNSPRIHWERGRLNIEPGIEAKISDHLCDPKQRTYWKETNLFFGGVHAVTRDPKTGDLSGGGDHRRGGVAVVVE